MLLDDIRSNRKMICADCGDKIGPGNHSGWEVFVEAGKVTQPVCKFCDVERAQEGSKEKDPEHGYALCA